MKNFIFITLLVFSSYTTAQDSYFSYIKDCDYFEHINSNPISNTNFEPSLWSYFQTSTTSQITDIQFMAFLGCATHISMGLVLTTDGGYNWTSVSFYDTNFTTAYNGVYFLNNLTGWAVGGSMQIRKTTNGGINWVRQIPPPVAGVLNSVFFHDANTGFAIGRKTANYNSCILRTINGGMNWNEVIASTANENELSDQYWHNTNTGWICGRSILLKTTNGGLNYTNYYSSIPPTSNGINALLSIYFENVSTGWIGSSNLDHKNIYKTTNSGLNWIFQDNPVSQFTYAQINDIRFIDVNWGWSAHGTPSSGAIMFTSNGGANWVIQNNTNTWFDCLWTYNDYIVYCGAGGGIIWYNGIPSGIKKVNDKIACEYSLSQNYPNPFNSMTNIRLSMKSEGNVKLVIYSSLGEEVDILLNKKLKSGVYEMKWDASAFPSGIYFYKLETENFIQTKRMIIIR